MADEEKGVEKGFILDDLRKRWDNISLQSKWWPRIINLIMSVIVFFCMQAVTQYGLQFGKSWMSALFAFMNSNSAILLLCEIALAAIWYIMPVFATILYSVLTFICLGGVSPVLMLFACLLMLFQSAEKRSVLFSTVIMPAFTIALTDGQWAKLFGESYHAPVFTHFLLTTSLGIFAVVFCAFASSRFARGTGSAFGFMIFSMIAMSFGLLGKIPGESGKSLVSYKKNYWPLFETVYDSASAQSTEKISPEIASNFDAIKICAVKILIVYLIIGIIFAVIVNLKPKDKKLQLDIRDGIAFAVLAGMLCCASPVISAFAGIGRSKYSPVLIIVQVLMVYAVTRPAAGRTVGKWNAKTGRRKIIFISYAHADIKRIMPYLKMLEKQGYEYWYDDGIRTGDRWQDVIASNLADCECFMAFISESSIISDYCTKEINYATAKKKPMAVVMLDDVTLPPVLEMHLASLQAIQRFKLSSDEACMEKVLELEQIKSCK